MRAVRLAAAAFAAAALTTAPAVRATDDVTPPTFTVAVPLATATYSRAGLQTYAGYTVNAVAGSKTVKNLSWRAKSSTTVPAGVVTYADPAVAQNATCTALDPATNSGYQVRCDIGEFQPAETASSALFFIAPAQGATLGASPNDLVDLSVEVSYLRYWRGYWKPVTQVITASPSIALRNDTDANQFATAVPINGGTFFTGDLGEPAADDPWTTIVSVPGATNQFVPAIAAERTDGILESSDLRDRRITELRIDGTNYFNGNPATSPRLVITLRRDLSTVRKGAKISNAVLYYTKTLTPPGGTPDDTPTADRRPVIFCAHAPGNANGPYLDETGTWRPCIRTREAFTSKKSSKSKHQPATGYWQWVIEAYENGRYVN